MINDRLANVALRIFSMGSRFILLIALARLLEPEDVGLYGLFMSSVIFAWQLVGGEVHAFSNRDLVRRPSKEHSFVVQHAAISISLLYVLFIPILVFAIISGAIPQKLALWFLPILVFEHLSQETHRLLNFIEQPLKASIVLLIKNGVWVWFALLALWLHPDLRELQTVLLFWLGGCIIAAIYGSIAVYKLIPEWRIWAINSQWLRKAYKTSIIFLVSSLSFRAITVFDRYAMSIFNGEELLGVYVLYAGLAMSIITIIDPAVIAFLLPKIVSAYHTGDQKEYKRLLWELSWSPMAISIVLALILAATAPMLFSWSGHEVYSENLALFWILLSAPLAYAAGVPTSSALYARGQDKAQALINLSGVFVFIATILVTSTLSPLYAPAFGVIGCLVWLAIIRCWALWKTPD